MPRKKKEVSPDEVNYHADHNWGLVIKEKDGYEFDWPGPGTLKVCLGVLTALSTALHAHAAAQIYMDGMIVATYECQRCDSSYLANDDPFFVPYYHWKRL